MTPVARTAAPLHVASGSTVIFAAHGCEQARFPQSRSANPFVGDEYLLFDATNSDADTPDEYENTTVLNAGPAQVSVCDAGSAFFGADDPVTPYGEGQVLLVDV